MPRIIDTNMARVFAPLEQQGRYIGAHGGRGSAKCLARGTNVMMFDGSLRAVEDVVVGDLLLGVDGTPRTVRDTVKGVDDLFRVKQLTAKDYVVTANHVLALTRSTAARVDYGNLSAAGNPQRQNGRYAQYGDDPSLMTVGEFASRSERFKCHFFGFKRGVEFPTKELPLDPYFLGLWLGDGTCDEPTITTMDPEIAEYILDTAALHEMRVSVRQKPDNRAATYAICRQNGTAQENILTGKLRALDVLCNKHIPHGYKCGDETQRLALLAGLIDTDGTAHGNCYHISQSRRRLLDDAKFIADSLGFKTNLRRKDASCNGTYFEAWHLSICGDIWRIPCRIARKRVAEEDVRKNKDWRRTRIDIEPIGLGEYFGFELDGDHLFFLEDFTVTHNSHYFAEKLVRKCVRTPGTHAVCIREVQKSLAQSAKRTIEGKIQALGVGPLFDVQKAEIKTPGGGLIIFQGMQNHTADSIKSLEGYDVAWVEEAQTLSQTSLRLLRPTLRKPGSELWFSWNPKKADDPVDDFLRGNASRKTVSDWEPPPRSIVVQANWQDNPWFHETELVADKDYDFRRDRDMYAHVWGGDYEKNSQARVFKNWKVEHFDPPPAGTILYGGADWGFSQDPTVGILCFIVGRTLYFWREVWAIGCDIDRTPALFDRLDPGWTASRRKDDPNWQSIGQRVQFIADSARPETISYMKKHGYPRIQSALKGAGSIEDGVEFLKSYDIIIHPDCVHTAQEFEHYSFKIDPHTDEITSVLEDKKNHTIDSARYAVESVRRRTVTSSSELRL